MRPSKTFLACVLAVSSICVPACGEGDGDPQARAVDYEAALADAPPRLAALYAEGDVLLGGGLEGFEAKLEELRGYPVVVNVWASWCHPCRQELPHFQSQAAKRGDRVAFLGVDSDDSEEAARTFLDDFPLPYPSFSDPDTEIRDAVGALYLPATAFYGADGKRRHVKQGYYRDERELAADIKRYAG